MNKKLIFLFIITFTFTFVSGKNLEHKIHLTLKLFDNFYIAKLDQIALLKKSIAVIQPTLFEGGPGGGASYDAISLGKPLIVSDIKVNQEIEQSERVFFSRQKMLIL